MIEQVITTIALLPLFCWRDEQQKQKQQNTNNRMASLQKKRNAALGQTKASLQAALDANRKLQGEILRQLQEINQRKRQNRREADRCIGRLARQEISQEQEEDSPSTSTSIPTQAEIMALFPQDCDTHKITTKAKRKQFQYDPARRWNLDFFTDPTGSRPEPNEDVKRRRKLEKDKFFYHKCPPWSKQEIKNLKHSIAKQQQQQQQVNYELVAQELQESRKGNLGLPATALPRSAKECQLYHQHTLTPAQPFTKEESLRILEEVQKAKDQQTEPDWQHITSALENNNRTTWQTFCHYRQHLEKLSTWTSTAEQDEFLLRYLAAQGPQFVWDTKAAAHLSASLPFATPKHLLTRTNQTLLNPNLTTDYWSIEPERKLILAMKVYDGYSNSSAVNMAANHFLDRSPPNVSRKWDRSLNPNLETNPFTVEEDDKLVQVVRSSNNEGFEEIARRHFPQRNGTQLYQRWITKASTEDIVQKYSERTIIRGIVKNQNLFSSEDFKLERKKESDGDADAES